MRSRLVLLVAIAALIVGVALGVVDLLKSEPQPTTTVEVVEQKKNEEHVAV